MGGTSIAMNQYSYKNLEIEIFNDSGFTPGPDNTHTYLAHYYAEGPESYCSSFHGVKISGGETEMNSCLLYGSGGSAGIYSNSSLPDNNRLVICCGDSLFCLNLPSLELQWNIQADMVTCFEVFKYENDYLVYGELEISRINAEGKIQWSFSGADIFVSMDDEVSFTLQSDHIALVDFQGNKYQVDFDGKLIWDSINYPAH